MAAFAKLFEVDGEQVLFFREPDTDNEADDREILHQVVNIDGVCADIKLCGMTYANVDKAFDMLDEHSARGVLKTVRDILAGK